MSETSVLKERLLNRFRELQTARGERDPDWLRSTRQVHAERFAELGLPNTREEEWRKTNLAELARTAFGTPTFRADGFPELPGMVRSEMGGARLVFVDGRHAPELSSTAALPEGVWAGSLAEALAEDPQRLREHLDRASADDLPALRAINAALAEDGGVIRIPTGRAIDEPIHLAFVSTGDGNGREATVSHPRTLILAGRSSRATVVESYTGLGEGTYLTNAVTEVHLGDDAALRHYRVQCESERAYHIATVESRQGADSRYEACHVNLGGRLVRNDVRGILGGEGGHCTLDGLCLTRGRQHLDNHTWLDHARPHCDSRELYKSILGGRSRTVFSGRIVVRPGAQGTDAKQSNPNLLLSAGALAHTRPQLEIHADDVKCTHGATIGRLDEDAIFYLRSRAISESAARDLLIEAFAGEVLDRIAIEPLRDMLGTMVRTRLVDLG